MASFNDLPLELHVYIFGFLDLRDVARLSSSNRAWRDASNLIAPVLTVLDLGVDKHRYAISAT